MLLLPWVLSLAWHQPVCSSLDGWSSRQSGSSSHVEFFWWDCLEWSSGNWLDCTCWLYVWLACRIRIWRFVSCILSSLISKCVRYGKARFIELPRILSLDGSAQKCRRVSDLFLLVSRMYPDALPGDCSILAGELLTRCSDSVGGDGRFTCFDVKPWQVSVLITVSTKSVAGHACCGEQIMVGSRMWLIWSMHLNSIQMGKPTHSCQRMPGCVYWLVLWLWSSGEFDFFSRFWIKLYSVFELNTFFHGVCWSRCCGQWTLFNVQPRYSNFGNPISCRTDCWMDSTEHTSCSLLNWLLHAKTALDRISLVVQCAFSSSELHSSCGCSKWFRETVIWQRGMSPGSRDCSLEDGNEFAFSIRGVACTSNLISYSFVELWCVQVVNATRQFPHVLMNSILGFRNHLYWKWMCGLADDCILLIAPVSRTNVLM